MTFLAKQYSQLVRGSGSLAAPLSSNSLVAPFLGLVSGEFTPRGFVGFHAPRIAQMTGAAL